MSRNGPLNLDEVGEWAGLWWLPDDPDDQVPGVLRYDGAGGLSLSLIGAFEDRIVSNPALGVTAVHEGSRTWDVMHGVAEQREITLFDAYPGATSRTFGARVSSPDRQTVTATVAIIGAHVRSQEELAFSASEVSIEDLGLWAASSVLEGQISAPEGRLDGSGCISVKPVEARSVVIGGTEYRLLHTHTLPYFDHRRGGTVGRMRDTASIRVAPAEPMALGNVLVEAGMLQDLIALATHRAAGVIWLRLEVAGTESVLPDGRALPRRRADVLYSPAALGWHDAKAIDHHRVLFTCDSLPFEEVLPRWCGTHSRLQAATNMILGLRYAPARYIENNLLTAVGAAEVLHRGLGIEETPFPKAEFTAMREAMLGQVPEEHRARFKGAIRNDLTLQDRLHVLAARPDQEAMALLLPDAGKWAKRTTRARNDLAHEGRTPNHSFEELIAVVKVTTAIVILNLLHELGLSPERQREIVNEHPELRVTSRVGGQWFSPAAADD